MNLKSIIPVALLIISVAGWGRAELRIAELNKRLASAHLHLKQIGQIARKEKDAAKQNAIQRDVISKVLFSLPGGREAYVHFREEYDEP